MVINGRALVQRAPIKNMLETKEVASGTTYGLGEAGYDIRLKQDLLFTRRGESMIICENVAGFDPIQIGYGSFTLASAMEEFQMPNNLVGVVHDKSSWARRGLSVFNTVIEPGWNGFLTLELVYHGYKDLHLPAGCGIAQVLFHDLYRQAVYTGRYQNQEDHPVGAIYAKEESTDEVRHLTQRSEPQAA
jgi:dCTP deaminase